MNRNKASDRALDFAIHRTWTRLYWAHQISRGLRHSLLVFGVTIAVFLPLMAPSTDPAPVPPTPSPAEEPTIVIQFPDEFVQVPKDAIKERERQRAIAQRNQNILADVARDTFESRKAELKGDGKAGRWFSPLELHVLPKLGKMPVSEIDQRDIRDTLAPI